MMMPGLLIILVPALILGCTVSSGQQAREPTRELTVVKADGFSFSYSTEDFSEATIETVRAVTAQEIGDGIDEGISPEHVCVNLQDKRPLPALDEGPRYFSPAYSFVCVIPLQDSSVEDFDEVYPSMTYYATALQELLRERPDHVERRRGIPDFPPNNASPSIVSKYQYLEFRSGSGLMFLTQYSNEMQPNPVNNEELTLDFQGLTDDGQYYVAARLAITNPALPAGIDFTDDIDRDMPSFSYLRNEEKALEEYSEDSFQPSLKSLKALLSSMQVDYGASNGR